MNLMALYQDNGQTQMETIAITFGLLKQSTHEQWSMVNEECMIEIFLSAPIGLQVIILGVPVSFFFVGRWLYDGIKQDKKRQERLNQIK